MPTNQFMGTNTIRFAGVLAVQPVSAFAMVERPAAPVGLIIAAPAILVQFQSGWRWCKKCQGLFFGPGSPQSACPAGGPHDGSTSGAYVMSFGNGGQDMQAGWRWCKKCQGLFFGPSSPQSACPAGGPHDGSTSGAYSTQIDPNPIPVKPASLPLVNSRSGNLFVDRNAADLHWYLPEFTLAEDVDPRFAFLAMQSGQDAEGNPFNKATVTLRMHKSQPDDVVKFSQANPTAKLQEIPLAEMTAILYSFYADDAGQQQARPFKAGIQDEGDGNFLLTFDSILALSVIGLYQDLTVFGKAVINFSASYQAWSQPGSLFLKNPFKIVGNAWTLDVARVEGMRSFGWVGGKKSEVVAGPPTSDTLTQTRQTWAKSLSLSLKYQQDGYQLKYTVSTATIPKRVIRHVGDLTDFSGSQTEFAELKALGDVSERYPTLSRLYIGVLSRKIVVIPRRYSVLRGRSGCAATCYALVDSSAADGSKCKFEFDFTIAPEISRIEFHKLTQEILNREELRGYTPTLPNFLHVTRPSTLQTDFKSGVAFAAGTDAKTFAVTVSIHADGLQTPAVANANLFITRLCSNTGADLVGSLSIKLDDGYPDPVLSTIVLNFAHTAGTDEIAMELEEGSPGLKLRNKSPLDLQLSRYALIKGPALTEVPGDLSVLANGSVSVPKPADHADLAFAADAQLAIPKPMKKSDVAKYLTFQTADVQETQYFVGVHGSGINFDKVDSLVASITFSNLPRLAPRPLKLNKNVRADSAHIVIPLENAVFSLPGTVNVTVHFVDRSISDVTFTVDNDFTSEPVLILLQGDIDRNLQQR